MKRIAVWNTAFMGDAVLTLPLIQSLRLRYPEASIDYYVRGGLAPLFVAHPDISNVFSYDKREVEKGLKGILRLGRTIAAREYSLWVSPHTSLRSAYMARAAKAGMSIGYSEPIYNRFCYTHTVDRRFGEIEEIERILQLLTPLGPGPISDWPNIVLPQEATATAEAFFQKLPSGPVLGMHPGSVWATKHWIPEYFAELGATALQHGVQVLIFAGSGEEGIARTILADIRGKMAGSPALEHLHDLVGKVNLPELAAFIRKLNCYVANDSGPMHMAWSMGVPVATIFGPTVRSFGFTPRSKGSRIFEADWVACRPCSRHGPQKCPKGHHRCMTEVRPETVWEGVREILGL